MIKKNSLTLLLIFALLFLVTNLRAQSILKPILKPKKIMEFELPQLNIVDKQSTFFNQVDSLVLKSDCKRLNKKKFNSYIMGIYPAADSTKYNIKVVLVSNVRDSINDIGFFRKGNAIFIVRGKNPDNLFYITNKNKKWMYKYTEGEPIEIMTPREKLEGSPIEWYFEYYDNKLHFIKMECFLNKSDSM